MSTTQAREVISVCECSQARLQCVADMLLLTNDLRPVGSEISRMYGEAFSNCRDAIIASMRGLTVFTRDINLQLNSVTAQWRDISRCLHELCETVVAITELCSHASYIVSCQIPNSSPAHPGIVDRYVVTRANLEIQLACDRLKNSIVEDLDAQLLLDICSCITKNLSVLTDSCKTASEAVMKRMDQDQFKLCIKSINSCASTLIASIKLFRTDPSEAHHRRCIAFCDALAASTNALITFSTEMEFTGHPAVFGVQAKDAQSAVLGTCMSIVSSCIQLYKTVKNLGYNNTSLRHRSKVAACTDSITNSADQLADILLQFQVEKGLR